MPPCAGWQVASYSVSAPGWLLVYGFAAALSIIFDVNRSSYGPLDMNVRSFGRAVGGCATSRWSEGRHRCRTT